MNTILLEILACPVCKGELYYKKEDQELLCKFDALAFLIIDEIPIMLTTRARRLGQDEGS